MAAAIHSSCGSGRQYVFKTPAAVPVPATQHHHQDTNFGNAEYHHFNHIGQDPNWAWDAEFQKTAGE